MTCEQTGPRGGALQVDTAELDEGVARVARVVEDLAATRVGLDPGPAGLGGASGLAVGADAVGDALADLARQWQAGFVRLSQEAHGHREALGAARLAYDAAEQDALRRATLPLVEQLGLPGLGPDGPPCPDLSRERW